MKSAMSKVLLALLLCQFQGFALAQMATPAAAGARTILRISGLVANANAKANPNITSEGVLALDEAAIDALPVHSFTTTTPWFKEKTTFSGPLLADLLDAVGIKGTLLTMRALNDYKVQVPVSDAYQYHPLLARKINNRPISVREKGPLFLIYPFDSAPELNTELFFARSIWQIKSIQVD